MLKFAKILVIATNLKRTSLVKRGLALIPGLPLSLHVGHR